MLIHKRAFALTTLIACLAAVFGCFGQSNVVAQPKAAAPPAVAAKPSHPQIGTLGDPAPPITVMEWVKGQPVKIRPGTNIYVLVFCTLSRANDFALTNLSLLQEQYRNRGVVVAAISDEGPDQLKALLQSKGSSMDFSVAADEIPSRTARNFLHSFGQVQLPRAFVVGKDGNVLWQGHPLTDGLGVVVDQIASGHYDLEQAKKKVLAREQMEQYLASARQAEPQASEWGRVLLAVRTNDATALCDLAAKIATDPYLPTRDVALATAALDRAEQISATNTTDINVDRAILLFQTGKEEAGLALAKRTLASAQSPDAKEEVQICIHAMEYRLAAAKTNQITAPANKP